MTANGKTFEVQIEAGIDLGTGQVFARFQSIDPSTSLPPDVLTGFYRGKIGPAGVLAAEEDPLPAEVRTRLEPGVISYYFRKRFTLEQSPRDLRAEMSVLIDDGAVFYLNGVEFYRIGLPAGPINANTRANRGVGNATVEGPIAIPNELLQRGDNVLAVEVHQISATNAPGHDVRWYATPERHLLYSPPFQRRGKATFRSPYKPRRLQAAR